jgi:hypothetical protein
MDKGSEFKVEDEDVEIMADAALGPESEDDADAALRLPGDLSPAQVHRQYIRDRLRAARLETLPSVHDVLSARRKRVFLIALAETGIISQACARAGWTRSTAQGLRKTDEDFAARWDDALEVAADAAEAEAFRRGVHGWEKDVYFKGNKVGKEVIYSDRLLEMTLKARRPDRFRDSHKMEVDAKGGVLIVPAQPSEGDWEDQSASGQAKFREAPKDGGDAGT